MDIGLRLFFEDLDKNDVSYCVWKGSADLEKSFNGQGDLDILIDPDSVHKMLEIISDHNIFLGLPNRFRVDASIYDLFFFSEESSRLIHIQMYTKIVFGQKSVSYDFSYKYTPLKNILLNKKRHDFYPIFILDEQIEAFFSVIRYSLKFGKPYSLVPIFSELKNIPKVDKDVLISLAPKLSDHENLVNMFKKGDKDKLFKEVYKKIIRDPGTFSLIRQNRLNNKIAGLIVNFFQLQKKIKFFRFNPHRRLSKGVALVFIGADGSGKSTQISRVTEIFQYKFNTASIYMGSGKGETSLLIKIFKMLRNLMKRKSKRVSISKGSDVTKMNIIKQYALAIYSISLAYSKKMKFNKLKSFLSFGAIVVCDRFPQSDINGSNDGPLLHAQIHSKSLILRILAKWELRIYQGISLNNINAKVIKLIPNDLEIVFRRRQSEMEWSNFKNRHIKFRQIGNLGSLKPLTIDASLPLNYVNKKVNEGIISFIKRK